MGSVELVPMTGEQFDAWLPLETADYAAEHVRTGRWSEEEAIQRSREEHERLLPQGLETPDHHLWSIVPTGGDEPVGLLWIHVMREPKPAAFIFNIEVYPQFRRRGFAEQAMLKLEEEARSLGLEEIRLHVFGHNSAARPLYEKLGYEPTNINMLKRLT